MTFHETVYGKRFFDAQLPKLIKAIERLAEAQEQSAAASQIPATRLDDETRKRLQEVLKDPCKCEAFAHTFYEQLSSDDESPESVGHYMIKAILNNSIEDFLIAVVGWSSKSLLDFAVGCAGES